MKELIFKVKNIFLNTIPILMMIGLIPIIKNDYFLTGAYLFISGVAFMIKYDKFEYVIYLFGFFAMIISEYLFVSTGVEIFKRASLFGLMPLWLPFLWAYGFVVIKRGVNILEN